MTTCFLTLKSTVYVKCDVLLPYICILHIVASFPLQVLQYSKKQIFSEPRNKTTHKQEN